MAALDYNPASAASASSQTLLIQHESKQDPRLIHPQSVTLAFEAQQWPELCKQIIHSDNVIAAKALFVALTYLPQPLEVSKAIKAGLLINLGKQSANAEPTIRSRVADCFRFIMADRANGHKAAASLPPSIEAVKSLSCDESPTTRSSAYQAVLNMSFSFEGASALVKSGIVPHLVARIGEEVSSDMHSPMTAALARCTNAHGQHGINDALSASCVRCCTELLSSELCKGDAACNQAVLAGSASVLMYTAVPHQGKRQLIEQGSIKVLMSVLAAKWVTSAAALAACAGGLMHVLIDDDAKRECLELGAECILTRLEQAVHIFQAKGESTAVVLNALRAATTLSAHPEGRQLCKAFGLVALIDNELLPAAVAAKNSTLECLVIKTRGVLCWKP
jgi:hypothetical protein